MLTVTTGKKLGFSFLVVFLCFMLCGSLVAFAATETTVKISSADASAMVRLFEELSESHSSRVSGNSITVDLKASSPSSIGETLFSLNKGGSELIFYPETFKYATDASKKEALSIFINGLQSSSVSAQTQNNIIDQLNASSSEVSKMLIPLVMDATSADLYTAMKFLKPILPIVRVIFGIGAIVISLFLIGTTIVDLCFIGLPVARERLQARQDERGGRIPFVSSDAVSVVRDVESSLESAGTYKNAYLLYFKRRILTYIILSICILYLVVGELGGLISWILTLGEGVVN